MYTPKFQPQLVAGVPTGGDDCVVRSAQMGIDYATSGSLIIKVADFRKRAGKQTGGLNTAQLEQGVESYDTPTETNRYRDLRCKRFVEGEWTEITDFIRQGEYVCAWINYGWLNRQYPELSGDPKFTGTHCIGVLGYRFKDGQHQARIWDPLCDGRREGIWRGPRWWKQWVLKQACAATEDVGEFRGAIIRTSSPL